MQSVVCVCSRLNFISALPLKVVETLYFHRRSLSEYFRKLRFKKKMNSAKLILRLAICLLLIGCKKDSGTAAGTTNEIRLGYIGLTCEAPDF